MPELWVIGCCLECRIVPAAECFSHRLWSSARHEHVHDHQHPYRRGCPRAPRPGLC